MSGDSSGDSEDAAAYLHTSRRLESDDEAAAVTSAAALRPAAHAKRGPGRPAGSSGNVVLRLQRQSIKQQLEAQRAQLSHSLAISPMRGSSRGLRPLPRDPLLQWMPKSRQVLLR